MERQITAVRIPAATNTSAFFTRVHHMNRLLKYLVSAAMLLSPLAAHSADLAVKSPPPPVPIFSWTGFYIGGNIGGAWANNDWRDSLFLTDFNNHNNGVFIGGGQVGGNYQIGQFVIGGEWDFDWAANHNNNTGVIIPGVGSIAVTNNDRWITTVAARFGWAVDRWLVYGKAGGGWVGTNNLTVTNLSTGGSLTCGNFSNFSCRNSTAGWLVGAGFEYAFANNWTVKLEYEFLGLGNRTFVIPGTAPLLAGDTFTSHNGNVQMVKVGFNYLFNWGAPVASRY
jgi:outer membrane immunogenic protein